MSANDPSAELLYIPVALQEYFDRITGLYSEYYGKQSICALPYEKAERGQCHDNASKFVLEHGGEVVPGWFLSDMRSHYMCMAHSLVRLQDGTLVDVTLDAKTLEHAGVFIPHEGTMLEFGYARANRAQVIWPPLKPY